RHKMETGRRDRVHAEEERWIDAALAGFAPALQAAPDGDGGARETCKSTGETAKKTRACVRQAAGPERSARPTQQQPAAIGDEQTSDDIPINGGLKMQEQIDAGAPPPHPPPPEHVPT